MAGSKPKYRHLSRSSAHRQALLRNLVTSLFEHESIRTTWHKAKEAQRLAEKLITLGKKNTNAARNRAQTVFYTPHSLMPKLFGPIRERYLNRPGGYTRVLRIEPLKDDQAASAILELVDGPKDMRFAMTARTVARMRGEDDKREKEGLDPLGLNDITLNNVRKVTRFRDGGQEAFEGLVRRFEKLIVEREEEREREMKKEMKERDVR